MKIALLCPSRKRPEMLERMYFSALETAAHPRDVYLFAYVDEDDESYADLSLPNAHFVGGSRIVLSEMWNRCWEKARGIADFYGHLGDDVIFRTNGWDEMIAYSFHPDKISFVHGLDGSDQDKIGFGTHGFLHKNWTDAVGYFVPPYFSSDWNDTWLNDVADMIGRHVVVEDVLIEHMHPVWQKRESDETDRERVERGERDGVKGIYDSKLSERQSDAQKLLKAIRGLR